MSEFLEVPFVFFDFEVLQCKCIICDVGLKKDYKTDCRFVEDFFLLQAKLSHSVLLENNNIDSLNVTKSFEQKSNKLVQQLPVQRQQRLGCFDLCVFHPTLCLTL